MADPTTNTSDVVVHHRQCFEPCAPTTPTRVRRLCCFCLRTSLSHPFGDGDVCKQCRGRTTFSSDGGVCAKMVFGLRVHVFLHGVIVFVLKRL